MKKSRGLRVKGCVGYALPPARDCCKGGGNASMFGNCMGLICGSGGGISGIRAMGFICPNV